MRLALKERADSEAIRVFAENLRHLLLSSPLGGKRVLALDPGFRTGCKVVVLDETGKLLENGVIFPHEPQRQVDAARREVVQLANRGTRSRRSPSATAPPAARPRPSCAT